MTKVPQARPTPSRSGDWREEGPLPHAPGSRRREGGQDPRVTRHARSLTQGAGRDRMRSGGVTWRKGSLRRERRRGSAGRHWGLGARLWGPSRRAPHPGRRLRVSGGGTVFPAPWSLFPSGDVLEGAVHPCSCGSGEGEEVRCSGQELCPGEKMPLRQQPPRWRQRCSRDEQSERTADAETSSAVIHRKLPFIAQYPL